MLLSDQQIREEIEAGTFTIEPFEDACLQPASYDLRIGRKAFTSSSRELVNLEEKGIVQIEPGEFAVVETLERVAMGPQAAGLLGLRSEYARRGLLMLSGPQVDPGFEGILVVRLVNVGTSRVALSFGEPLLTLEVVKLTQPVAKPYAGPYQHQKGITSKDIQELTQTEGLTLGQVLQTLNALAADVSDLARQVERLRGSVGRLSWAVPAIVAFGIAVIAAIIALK